MDDEARVAAKPIQSALVAKIAQDDLDLQVPPEWVDDISPGENANAIPGCGEFANEVTPQEARRPRDRHQAGGHP